MADMSKAELTSGPSGSISLVGMPEPTGNEQIVSKMDGSGHEMTAPGGATEVSVGAGAVTPGEFTAPGGAQEI